MHMCAIGMSVQIHHTFDRNTVICRLGKCQLNDNVSKQNAKTFLKVHVKGKHTKVSVSIR